MSTDTSILRDPVCGMEVEIDRSPHSATYRGLVFHFCSSQCLENFQNNPTLYALHIGLRSSLGIPPISKQRRLRLAACQGAEIENVCRCIKDMMGISSVRVEKDSLIVEYDLKQATLSQIEAIVIAQDLKFSDGLHRFQRWLWRSAESNELDNLAHPGTGDCCNHPPAARR